MMYLGLVFFFFFLRNETQFTWELNRTDWIKENFILNFLNRQFLTRLHAIDYINLILYSQKMYNLCHLVEESSLKIIIFPLLCFRTILKTHLLCSQLKIVKLSFSFKNNLEQENHLLYVYSWTELVHFLQTDHTDVTEMAFPF